MLQGEHPMSHGEAEVTAEASYGKRTGSDWAKGTFCHFAAIRPEEQLAAASLYLPPTQGSRYHRGSTRLAQEGSGELLPKARWLDWTQILGK